MRGVGHPDPVYMKSGEPLLGWQVRWRKLWDCNDKVLSSWGTIQGTGDGPGQQVLRSLGMFQYGGHIEIN